MPPDQVRGRLLKSGKTSFCGLAARESQRHEQSSCASAVRAQTGARETQVGAHRSTAELAGTPSNAICSFEPRVEFDKYQSAQPRLPAPAHM
jgi:hypothetical protein